MKAVFITLILITMQVQLYAQDEIENVRLALNSGSAKELVRYFNNRTEVKINDVGNNYSIAQAEPILRDFFQQYPPTAFSYIHKGQSPKGLKYNIGKYESSQASFRVVILMKSINGSYVVDTITLNEQ